MASEDLKEILAEAKSIDVTSTSKPDDGKKKYDSSNRLGSKRGSYSKGGKKPVEPVKEVPLPEADPMIAAVIRLPFEVWARANKMPELKLTEAEALSMSVPVNQLLRYYLPDVSPIAYVWLSFACTTGAFILPRIDLVVKKKKEVNAENTGSENNVDIRSTGMRENDVSEKVNP